MIGVLSERQAPIGWNVSVHAVHTPCRQGLRSSALEGRLVHLKRSTPGRKQRYSLETSSQNYKTGSVQCLVHRALGVVVDPALTADGV